MTQPKGAGGRVPVVPVLKSAAGMYSNTEQIVQTVTGITAVR